MLASTNKSRTPSTLERKISKTSLKPSPKSPSKKSNSSRTSLPKHAETEELKIENGLIEEDRKSDNGSDSLEGSLRSSSREDDESERDPPQTVKKRTSPKDENRSTPDSLIYNKKEEISLLKYDDIIKEEQEIHENGNVEQSELTRPMSRATIIELKDISKTLPVDLRTLKGSTRSARRRIRKENAEREMNKDECIIITTQQQDIRFIDNGVDITGNVINYPDRDNENSNTIKYMGERVEIYETPNLPRKARVEPKSPPMPAINIRTLVDYSEDDDDDHSQSSDERQMYGGMNKDRKYSTEKMKRFFKDLKSKSMDMGCKQQGSVITEDGRRRCYNNKLKPLKWR